MSFVSILKAIGRDFKKVIDSPSTIAVERVAAGVGTMLFPALGPLFNSTANAVILAEQKYAALGKQDGSGPQKLSDVLQITEPVIAQALADAGKSHDTAAVTAYINGVVAILNSIPSSSTGQGS